MITKEYLKKWFYAFFYKYPEKRTEEFEKLIDECLVKGGSDGFTVCEVGDEKYFLIISLRKGKKKKEKGKEKKVGKKKEREKEKRKFL